MSEQIQDKSLSVKKFGYVVPIFFVISLMLISIAVWYKFFNQSNPGNNNFSMDQKIIVIDIGKLVQSATKQFSTGNAIPSSEDVAKVALAIRTEVDRYKTGDTLIMNSYSMIYIPDGIDKTKEIADKIGITLE